MKHHASQLARVLAACVLGFVLYGCGGNDAEDSNTRYSQVVVLGASLSDTGNASTLTAGLLPGAGYYEGRWSNGPLWIDSLAAELGLPVRPSLRGGTNYAFGGARTCDMPSVTASPTDMCGQLVSHLAAIQNKADANALYVIDASSAGNNITAAIGNGLPSGVITTDAATDVILIMQALYKAGARHFLVANVPDVGDTPRYRQRGSADAANASQLSQGFNASLGNLVNAFRLTHSSATVKQVNLYAATKDTTGFTNVTEACLNTDTAVACANPDQYLYWDGFHPTAALGRRWYAWAADALRN
jgi:phospholipase/lecithinase/hemolysin